MAEAHSAGNQIPPTYGSRPASVSGPLIAYTAMPVATGTPIAEVPVLVEPIGFADPPAEIRPPAITRRPVRRRFLPPVSIPAPDADNRSPPASDLQPRMPARPQLVALSLEPGDRPTGAPEPPGTLAFPSRQADAATMATAGVTPRRSRRPLLVGAGVAAALAVAAVLEIGVSVDWLSRMHGVVMQALAGTPASSSSGEPPSDPARRIAYYTDRAKAGDAAAQIALGVIYAKGEGVAQDYAIAASWFRRAAEKGAGRAQYDLGVAYERGRGVPSDRAQAVAWYRKAADQGHPLAQFNLAVSFIKGEGVRRDPFEAAIWYHRAAAQGVVAAMVNLAILYEHGEGVDASTVDAYAWYRAAARRGSAPAARRADELLHDFSPWDQTRAEARMSDIAASIHDAVGERSRSAVPSAPATSAAPGPILKSGIESARNPPGGAAEAANP